MRQRTQLPRWVESMAIYYLPDAMGWDYALGRKLDQFFIIALDGTFVEMLEGGLK